MDNTRRARFIAWFEGKPLLGDRKKLMDITGKTKGRVAQYFDSDQPFGERAAREIARAFDLGDEFFESDKPKFVLEKSAARPTDKSLAEQETHGTGFEASGGPTSSGNADHLVINERAKTSSSSKINHTSHITQFSDRALSLAARFDQLSPERKPKTYALLDAALSAIEDEDSSDSTRSRSRRA